MLLDEDTAPSFSEFYQENVRFGGAQTPVILLRIPILESLQHLHHLGDSLDPLDPRPNPSKISTATSEDVAFGLSGCQRPANEVSFRFVIWICGRSPPHFSLDRCTMTLFNAAEDGASLLQAKAERSATRSPRSPVHGMPSSSSICYGPWDRPKCNTRCSPSLPSPSPFPITIQGGTRAKPRALVSTPPKRSPPIGALLKESLPARDPF